MCETSFSIDLLRRLSAPPKLLRLLRRTQYKVAYRFHLCLAQNFVDILQVSKIDQGILRNSEAQKLIWES